MTDRTEQTPGPADAGKARETSYKINMTLSRKGRNRLLWLGLLIGVVSGLTAVLYRLALSGMEDLRGLIIAGLDSPGRVILYFLGLLLLGGAVCLLVRSEPLIKGSGIPQVEGQIQGFFSPRWLRVLSRKFLGGCLCILGGLSLGREGPSIQLGAMAAQGLSSRFTLSRADQRYLLTCGACAGLAAAFNAPLAGLMFGLEEIQKNFSSRAIFPALIASVTADVVSKLFFGTGASLGIALPTDALPLQFYWLYLPLGLLMGLAGFLYNNTLFGLSRAYRLGPWPEWLQPLLPFLLAGVTAFVLPEVLGGGHGLITGMAAGSYTVRMLLLLLAGKFIFSMLSFCSGAPGGIFFPLLVLGGLIGSVFGELAVAWLGLPPEMATRFMLLGMAGMFSAVVRAPLTGIILVLEMSASLTQLLGLSIVAGLSWLVADLLGSKPVYEQMLDNMTAAQPDRPPVSGEQSIIEITLPYKSALVGRRVRDISWPSQVLVVTIIRGDKHIMPKGDTVMESGDILAVACYAGEESLIRSAIDDISNWAAFKGGKL
ncbi:MAG: ClC family H(+)/Cl(-) exchange transporter [Firmicutes bacterium]|nr:ClC family H(+)/Cl(-) exchange transporter [Bacillota bacterium]